MHRTLIRLPAVIGLALPALALSLAAFVGPALASEPPAATAAALRTADEHDHSGTPTQGATIEPAPEPTPSATASTQGMAGMAGMAGMDHDAVPGDHTARSGEPAKDGAGATARPRLAVLSTFAGVNGAVLISARVLRRRDRARRPGPPRRSTPPTTV